MGLHVFIVNTLLRSCRRMVVLISSLTVHKSLTSSRLTIISDYKRQQLSSKTSTYLCIAWMTRWILRVPLHPLSNLNSPLYIHRQSIVFRPAQAFLRMVMPKCCTYAIFLREDLLFDTFLGEQGPCLHSGRTVLFFRLARY